jgi:UrcA family protein
MNSRRVLPAFSAALALATGLMMAPNASGQTTTTPLVVHGAAPAGSEIKDETIKVADLNLNTDAGAETLIGRVRAASKRVCAPLPTGTKANFKDVSDYEKCRDQATERAIKDSGSAKAAEILKLTGD